MFFAWRSRTEAAVVTLGAGGLLLVQLVMTGHQTLSPSFSTAHLAGTIRPLLDADTPFYSVRTYEHTLPFYLNRTMTLVEYETRSIWDSKSSRNWKFPPSDWIARWKAMRKALR